MRKGMMKGSGKRGYHNIIGKDPMVHSQSAKGIKQPQKIPNYDKWGDSGQSWTFQNIPDKAIGGRSLSGGTIEDKRQLVFRKIAREEGIRSELFEDFMMRRLPNEEYEPYIREWAQRFKSGNPVVNMDIKGREIYKKIIMYY